MLSYRHGFHAGNPADVVKHAVLIFCLDYLAQKPKPFMYIDTHAGAGSYLLDEGFAAQNREWAQGIGTMAGTMTGRAVADAGSGAGSAGGMIRRYLEVALKPRGGPGPSPGSSASPAFPASSASPDHGGAFPAGKGPSGGLYPGSPLVAAELLRAGDQGRCFELHPADFLALQKLLAGDRRFRAGKEDGLAALASLLPPASRRGLIFIDPPYEVKEEYPRLLTALRDSLGRFPTGLYLIWYPLLGGAVRKTGNQPYGDTLMGLYGGTRCRVELRFGPPRTGAGAGGRLRGCALVLFNPPWTLKAALEEAMPVFAERLGNGSWDVSWRD